MATILSIIAGLVTITIMVLTKMSDRYKEIKELKDAEDKKIDSVTDADSVLDELDRLRNKPTSR